MRFLRGILFLGVLSYGLAAAAAYWGQGRMLYAPDGKPLSDCALPEGVEVWSAGIEQGLLSDDNNDNLLLFFHGNAGSACNWRYLGVNHAVKLGFDVLVLEYPGYGGDARTPGKIEIESGLKTLAAWVEAQNHTSITVMGYSLGTGVAGLYAQDYGADQVILFAPFDSVYNVALSQGLAFPRVLLREDFDNMQTLATVNAPITIIHGADDIVISAEHSLQLQEHLTANGRDVRREVRTAVGHYGLFENPDFDTFLKHTLQP